MTQEAQQDVQSVLTPEVKAMIGVEGDLIESWGTVDIEYLRRFTQAVMDPDPRYWDEEFAKTTHYGEIIVPPIMVSYMTGRIRPAQEAPITKAFEVCRRQIESSDCVSVSSKPSTDEPPAPVQQTTTESIVKSWKSFLYN